MKSLFSVFLIFFFFSCSNKGNTDKGKKTETKQPAEASEEKGWEDAMSAVVNLESYDGTRILESGQGFFVTENVIATRLSTINQADKVVVSPVNSNYKYNLTQYVAIDRINDIILLKAESLNRKPVKLFTGTVPDGAKTIYLSVTPGNNIKLFSGKFFNRTTVQGSKLYRISNRIGKSTFGAPVFISSKEAIGIVYSGMVNYEPQSLVIPSAYIMRLLESQSSQPLSLESLRSVTNEKTAAVNQSIKGLVLETEMGNITIRLFNETPEYRDNFIKLTKEKYYDSLLIHRVIANFGIQTGAADTRYVEEGDMVGWKGPGYTLPAHLEPGLFHKRGMIGSPRKPDTQNQRRRSDGSQFYIVSGRRYFDQELDELEKQNSYKFTAEQRRIYKTTGGAHHLDGSYTVFGEVISGMEVVDKIASVETDRDWRPVEDIRLIRVKILK